jgi:hypothetical protein
VFTAERVPIDRPLALISVAGLLAAACLTAFASLAGLRSELERQPALVLREPAMLVQALADGPFVRLPASDSERPPSVWLIGTVDNENAARRTREALMALQADEVPVHVMLIAAGEDPTTPAAQLAAAVARSGDASLLFTPRDGQPLPSVIADQDEAAGYALWAVQTHERIASALAADHIFPEAPLLIWRSGAHLRVIPGADADMAKLVHRDRQRLATS